MGIFSLLRHDPAVWLNSRTNTTISTTVPPNNPDFSSVASAAHTFTVQELVGDLGTSAAHGLSKNEAGRRLEAYGENLLADSGGVSAWKVLVGQLGRSSRPLPSFCWLKLLE